MRGRRKPQSTQEQKDEGKNECIHLHHVLQAQQQQQQQQQQHNMESTSTCLADVTLSSSSSAISNVLETSSPPGPSPDSTPTASERRIKESPE